MWQVIEKKVTGSTNADAMLLGREGAKDRTAVTALMQTAGRGRMDRSWSSPAERGLYLSALVRPKLPAVQAGLLSFCGALAVQQAVVKATRLHPMIKWPNDVVCERKKICGILSACEYEGESLSFAVIGMGLNLKAGAYPPELAYRATSLEELDAHPSRLLLLKMILDRLDVLVYRLEHEGFSALKPQLRENCITLGQQVKVSGGTELKGTAVEIEDDGGLLIKTDQGLLQKVHCGDVSVRGIMGYV